MYIATNVHSKRSKHKTLHYIELLHLFEVKVLQVLYIYIIWTKAKTSLLYAPSSPKDRGVHV